VALDQQGTNAEMPFLDHLEELRWRILKMLGALVVVFIIVFAVIFSSHVDVIDILVTPIKPYLHGKNLVFTHVVDPFTILLQITGVISLALASPVIGYQLWAFLAPALNEREKKMITPVLTFGSALFLSGVAFCVWVFIPQTMRLMELLPTKSLTAMYTADEYFGFLFMTAIAFGAMFELPVVMLIATYIGIVTPKFFTKYRRHAFVACLFLCELVTPGDLIVSTLILFVPVYGLYEVGVLASWFVYRAREKRLAQELRAGAE
jgi:sec-independent protein translocase protein TatC